LELLGLFHALEFKLELVFGDFMRSPLEFQSTRDIVGVVSGTGATVTLSVSVEALPALAAAEPVWAEAAAAPPVITSAILVVRLALAREASVAPLAGREPRSALPVPRLAAIMVPVFIPRAVTIVVTARSRSRSRSLSRLGGVLTTLTGECS
jgi:hypothetical protein